MTAQKVKDLLLKIDNGGGFVTIGGFRTTAIRLNAASVDITHSLSPGWRELLADGGVKTAQLSGNGVFLSDAAAEILRASFFAGTLLPWQIILPGFGTLDGAFLITALEFGGDYKAEAKFSMTAQSAGPLSFTTL